MEAAGCSSNSSSSSIIIHHCYGVLYKRDTH
jgi:hypothetical protein